jgi:hypothetical protein
VALVVEVFLLRTRPERTWYEGRAAAESVKTLTWRYAVGGDPFGIDRRSPREIDELFLQRLEDILSVLRDLDLSPLVGPGAPITASMRKTRAASLQDRRTTYETGRINDQQSWYQAKADWNSRRAERWSFMMVTVESLGMIAAIMKATGQLRLDLLGFAGTIVAAIAAWLQMKQHQALAKAYTVASLELANVRARVTWPATEQDWSRFVADAEDAISREHRLWKASHGVRPL